MGAMDPGVDDQACPRCGTPRRQYLRYCPSCSYDLGDAPPAAGVARPAGGGSTAGMTAVSPKRRVGEAARPGRAWGLISLLVGLVPVALFIFVIANPLHIAWPGANPPSAAPDWAPADFHVALDAPSVAWRWMGDGEFSCPSGHACVGVDVLARDGCRTGVSGEITVENDAKVAQDTIRTEAGPVAAGGHATLLFDVTSVVRSGWAVQPVVRCR